MRIHFSTKGTLLLLLTACSIILFCNNLSAQSRRERDMDNNDENVDTGRKKKKDKDVNVNHDGFHLGFITGMYFPNKATAVLYDGHGENITGTTNDFAGSFMNRKINEEYGGQNGVSHDRIAEALGVQQGDWSFGPSDMPDNMKYKPAFLFGLQTRTTFQKKNSLLFNVSVVNLIATGNFTITMNTSTLNPTAPGSQNYKVFGIVGSEQRLLLQAGYQRLLGKNPNGGFFVEGGLNGTIAKYISNAVQINNLNIDLSSYYAPGVLYGRPRNLTGFGPGAFAGCGLHLSMSAKTLIEFVYQSSLETINIGPKGSLLWQQHVGIRAYGKF